MPRFPYFGFPNMYYRNYRYYHNYPNINNFAGTSNRVNPNPKIVTKQEIVDNKQIFIKNETPENRIAKDDAFLDLFGLKLHFDDILLISLIFFLYNEGVKDEGLFLALVMLLLT